jgi:hypothetical protein
MSLPITLAALENRVWSVGASLCAAEHPAEVAADLVGLRGEIGAFLDRHGIDITDEVWSTLISAMERIDGTIAHLRRAGIRFA